MNRAIQSASWLIGLLALLFVAGPALALDAESQKPYKLTVVLRVAEHRLLTPVFKEQLARELRDSLQDALGTSLVEVTVTDQHPILAEIDQHGLQQALEKFKDAEPGKVHVVRVDYVDGQYEIQTGQYDGLTGLASPVLRRVRLDDPSGRQLVARTAALLIERDLGLVGTILGDTKNPGRIRVALKGGRLGVPLDRWVKKDEVFAVVQVNRLGGPQRVRDALLQVVTPPDADGVCICKLHARHYESEPESRLTTLPGVLGYRCLKLGTTDGRLRLRLVNDRGVPHFNLQVSGGRHGLDAASDQLEFLGSTDREGQLHARGPFKHTAFVIIQNGQTPVARIPLPILEDHVAVRTLVLDERTVLVDELIAQRDRHTRRLDDCRQLQVELGKTLRQLLAKSDQPGALEEAKRGRERLERDLRELQAEHDRLTAEVSKAKLSADVTQNLLADGGRRKQLEDSLQQLGEFVTARGAKIEQQEQVKQRADLVDQARLLRREAQFDEALKLYEEALARFGKTPQLEKETSDLKTAWALKNDEGHRDARRFIYELWPKLDSAEKIVQHLDEARRHVEECKKVGDRLTPLRLLVASTGHSRLLVQQLDGLRRDRQDERSRAEALKAAAEGLRKLLDEVGTYLGGK